MSDEFTGPIEHYPECVHCGEPVLYDQIRGYYEHEDTAEVLHIDCYEEYVETDTGYQKEKQ